MPLPHQRLISLYPTLILWISSLYPYISASPQNAPSRKIPRMMDSFRPSSYIRQITSSVFSYFFSNKKVGKYRYTSLSSVNSFRDHASSIFSGLNVIPSPVRVGSSEKSFFSSFCSPYFYYYTTNMMKCHYRIYKYLYDCNLSASPIKQRDNDCHAKNAMPKTSSTWQQFFDDRSLLYGNVLRSVFGIAELIA